MLVRRLTRHSHAVTHPRASLCTHDPQQHRDGLSFQPSLTAMLRRSHPWGFHTALARASKNPLKQLDASTVETIMECLAPAKCPCKEVSCCNRCLPRGFYEMKSSELRTWGKLNNRPDLTLHADCVEGREKLDECFDEMENLRGMTPGWLDNKVENMWLYGATGCWPSHFGRFPPDGVFAEFERIKTAVALIEEGNEATARALWSNGAASDNDIDSDIG